jgi:hypothetical protein
MDNFPGAIPPDVFCRLMTEITGKHFDPSSKDDLHAAAAEMESLLEDDTAAEMLIDKIGAELFGLAYAARAPLH